MHHFFKKHCLVLALSFAALFALLSSCAGTPRAERSAVPGERDNLVALHKLWNELHLTITSGNVAQFSSLLTQDSYDWLENLVEETERMPAELIEMRPFHEVFLILGTRFLFRNNELGSYNYSDVVAAIFREKPLRDLFHRTDVGEFWYEDLEAWRGLECAPSVPLFYFKWENGQWKLDLQQTLPIVLHGFESVSLKKKMSTTETVIYLLNMHLKYRADETLLQP